MLARRCGAQRLDFFEAPCRRRSEKGAELLETSHGGSKSEQTIEADLTRMLEELERRECDARAFR